MPPNLLIHETSPYLLQHADNPVNWRAWNDETLAQAQKENKLILVSIGYSTCHWCHVMEQESFESESVAQTMNAHFINIKVDREERPDIDQIYMNALQIMTGSGGWPLNAVALPDGRPVWASSYMKKEDWIYTLEQIAKLYKTHKEKLYGYADRLEQGLRQMDMVYQNPDKPSFEAGFLVDILNNWQRSFDYRMGGFLRPPKFMLPNNFQFLLRWAHQNKDEIVMNFVHHTLVQMAFGGLYDQVGGGFSRYSVDENWHVPHFEKMLYDNGQLVSLYAQAYRQNQNPLYKEVVFETIEFVKRELMLKEGIFYSALDADSINNEGKLEEGAFYVWTKNELETLLGNDFEWFSDYYNVNSYGLWEHGHYVLIRTENDTVFCARHQISLEDFIQKKNGWKKHLQAHRANRSKPRLDDKTLTAWSAQMATGFAEAYKSFGEPSFLEIAEKTATFILTQQANPNGGLFRNFKNGKSSIDGFLIDYATTIELLLELYPLTGKESWLTAAKNLTNYVFDYFYDDSSGMFYFTTAHTKNLVARSMEYRDNVIPASNSIMAKNLFKLGHYFGHQAFVKTAQTMLNNVLPEAASYPSGFSNWLDLMLNFTHKFYEVAIVGDDALAQAKAFFDTYNPQTLVATSTKNSLLTLTKDRYLSDKTLFYVCINNTCQLPTKDLNIAVGMID